MSNSFLSQFYDALFQDLEGTKRYLSVCFEHHCQSPVLELAAGSGDLSHVLQEEGYDVIASDVDEVMLLKASEKGVKKTLYIDMTVFETEKMNTILCFGDSFNYLLTKQSILSFFKSVKQSLSETGQFLFDMHTQFRLNEFEEEYLEEGNLGDIQYQWSALKQDDLLCHQFIFFKDTQPTVETITQRVYLEEEIDLWLDEAGFSFKKLYDFNQTQPSNENEKVFYVCHHKEDL